MLADIDSNKATFVVLKKSIDHYTVRTEAFLFVTLIREAEFLIDMPLNVFHQLSDSLPGEAGSTWKNIVFMFNAGRSGSTLLARIVEEADPEVKCSLDWPILH